jgi:hypothetical protein
MELMAQTDTQSVIAVHKPHGTDLSQQSDRQAQEFLPFITN